HQANPQFAALRPPTDFALSVLDRRHTNSTTRANPIVAPAEEAACPRWVTPRLPSASAGHPLCVQWRPNGRPDKKPVQWHLSILLEPISKSSEKDNEAGELDKAEEVLSVVLPADKDATLPLYPGEEPLDEPASHVTA